MPAHEATRIVTPAAVPCTPISHLAQPAPAQDLAVSRLSMGYNLDDALLFSDRVLALREGRLSLDAAAPALDKSRLRRVYS